MKMRGSRARTYLGLGTAAGRGVVLHQLLGDREGKD
jgi:hypothetical protein